MKRWIGTDESGKGDYFGGLVVAGVMVDETMVPKLKDLGVRDSKKLSDSRVKLLSEAVRKICSHSVVSIGPPKYNELYSKLRNLNRILAWGHARVIENLLGVKSCELAVADKFGDKRYIGRALMQRGRQIKLLQRAKAEADVAVAAASVLARDKFLRELEKIGMQIGTLLPKGAGPRVEEVARDLVKLHGNEVLEKVAKTHFKTSHKIKEILHPERDSSALHQNDRLERLWAPWRIKYIYSAPSGKCIFCEANSKKDEEAYVLYRNTLAFVLMNTYPYNNGHLMIAPYRHVGGIEEVTKEEATSMFGLLQKSIKVLKTKMRAEGFNIGMNLGKVAGAGVADHIHIHIVPRWAGDVNFMPIISDTKVISQSLKEAYKLLKEGFEESENA